MSWRLRWAATQVLRPNFKKHRAALENPWMYWGGLALKVVPGVWPRPIELRLRDGGQINAREFGTLYIYKEIFVDHCYDINLPNNARILDIGANTGLFDLRMKQLFPQAVIHAYEPMPHVFEQLRETTASLSDVTLFQSAVGAESGTAKLYVHPGNIGGHSMFPQLASAQSVDIDVLDVHTAIARLGEVDLLKADCEGAEYKIIKSLTRESPVKNIMWEATPSLYDPLELKWHLQGIGYQIFPNRAGTLIAWR